MKTILRLLELASAASNDAEIVQLVDGESERCASSGDLLGAGEWYVSRLLDYSSQHEAGPILAKVIALWASPVELNFAPADLKDLSSNLHQFNPSEVVTAVAGLLARRSRGVERHSALLKDLVFRISEVAEQIFGIKRDRPFDVLMQAAALIRTKVDESAEALRIFNNSKGISARESAIEVIKRNRQLKPFLLLRERPVLSEVEMLLGSAFRSFCQAYERGESEKVLSHVDEIGQQARQTSKSDTHANSVIWHLLVRPLADHIVALTDEASRSFKIAATPALKLATDEFKVDLSRVDATLTLSARLVNEGSGDTPFFWLVSPGCRRNPDGTKLPSTKSRPHRLASIVKHNSEMDNMPLPNTDELSHGCRRQSNWGSALASDNVVIDTARSSLVTTFL
jgi:hypothetical protein